MLMTGLLVGGSAAYLGSRMIQQRRKPHTLMQTLRPQELHSQILAGRYELSAKVPSKSTLIVAASGIAVVGSTIWMASRGHAAPLATANQLIGWLQSSSYGPLIYIAVYTVGPLLFLVPATILSVSGGLLYGPIGGTILATVGGNLSALVAYGIGRSLRNVGTQSGQDDGSDNNQSIINGQSHRGRTRNMQHKVADMKMLEPYVKGMQERTFATVLALRFLYLPYDLVNYAAGILGLKWQPFLLASALGSLPGTLSFVLAGASIQGGTITRVPTLNPATLAASGAVFAGSLAISHYINKSQATQTEAEKEASTEIEGPENTSMIEAELISIADKSQL